MPTWFNATLTAMQEVDYMAFGDSRRKTFWVAVHLQIDDFSLHQVKAYVTGTFSWGQPDYTGNVEQAYRFKRRIDAMYYVRDRSKHFAEKVTLGKENL